MSQKIIDETTGEEVEVFTQEELQAQKEVAIEEFKKDNPDKSADLKVAIEELEKFKGKDFNFGKLREQKEAAEKKVEDILNGVDEKITAVKKEVLDGVMKDHYTDTINKLTGGDKDLIAKIELQYKRLGDSAGTKSEIEKKLNDAFILATGGQSKGINNSAFSSGGVGKPNFGTQGETKLTDEEKKMAQELAAKGGMVITEKDLEGK